MRTDSQYGKCPHMPNWVGFGVTKRTDITVTVSPNILRSYCQLSLLKGPGSARAKRLQNGPFAHWPCSLSSPLALPARANYWSQLHGASGEATQTTDMNSSAAGYTTPTSRQHAAGAAAASLIHTRGGHGAACVALCSRQALATGRSVFLDKTSTFISSHLPPKYRAVDLHGHGCDASARVVRDRLVKKFGS